MKSADVTLIAVPGTSCSAADLGAFVELVRAGGEVSSQGLIERVREAPALVFAYLNGALAGVSALKAPKVGYRSRVSKNSGSPLSASLLPFELGWVYVLPWARGQGISLTLSQAALAARPSSGAFATTRTDNEAMQRSLIKLGFAPVGTAYQSERGKHSLRVFLRHAVQQVLQTNSPDFGGPAP